MKHRKYSSDERYWHHSFQQKNDKWITKVTFAMIAWSIKIFLPAWTDILKQFPGEICIIFNSSLRLRVFMHEY